MKDWLTASLEKVWSTRFLGLDENGIQKLEFQNPPYVAAQRLGGDPREYNRVFAIQLNGCTYECAFCFVPREINDPEFNMGCFFSAHEMIDYFEKIRKASVENDGKDIKVIRLTGGEATSIVPEIILDIWNEIDSRGLSNTVYLWIDTNLSTKKYIEKVSGELQIIFTQRNVGIVGCVKTIGDGTAGKEDFAIITKAEPRFSSMQFNIIDFLITDLEADFYLYIVPILSGNKDIVMQRIEKCVKRLREIDENLPLRTNLIHIHYEYDPVERNLERARVEGRHLPITNERIVLDTWHNKVLPRFYSKRYLSKLMCQIPLKQRLG